MSRANRSAKGFFLASLDGPASSSRSLGVANLLTDGDQFPHQVAEAAVLGDLRLGVFDGRTLLDDLGDRFATDSMGERMRGTVSRGALLSAVAVRLTTLTETRSQKTRTQISDTSQAGSKLIALFAKCP
jgi:hypothetical protein